MKQSGLPEFEGLSTRHFPLERLLLTSGEFSANFSNLSEELTSAISSMIPEIIFMWNIMKIKYLWEI